MQSFGVARLELQRSAAVFHTRADVVHPEKRVCKNTKTQDKHNHMRWCCSSWEKGEQKYKNTGQTQSHEVRRLRCNGFFLLSRQDMPSSMNTFHVNHAMPIALLCSLACFMILRHICHTVCFVRRTKLRNMNETHPGHLLAVQMPFCYFSNCFIWWTYGWGGCLE